MGLRNTIYKGNKYSFGLIFLYLSYIPLNKFAFKNVILFVLSKKNDILFMLFKNIRILIILVKYKHSLL